MTNCWLILSADNLYSLSGVQLSCKNFQDVDYRNLGGDVGIIGYELGHMVGDIAVRDPGQSGICLVGNGNQEAALLF